MTENTIDALSKLYGSDKCPAIAHSYAPFYDELFKDKKDARAILELGAGSTSVMRDYSQNYTLCASLRVWSDYFAKAEIYGLDINPECDIKENRIHIVIGDQRCTEDLQKLVDISGGNFDVIIDDCSHRIEDQLFSAHFLLPYLKADGIYCIEDIYDPEINFQRMKDEFGLKGYECKTYEFVPGRNDCLAVITVKT